MNNRITPTMRDLLIVGISIKEMKRKNIKLAHHRDGLICIALVSALIYL